MSKTNGELQQDVLKAIQLDPLLEPAEIGVSVVDGIVSLTGIVDKLSKRSHAEIAAANVDGVQAVVENIQVNDAATFKRNDIDITEDILTTWDKISEIPTKQFKVKVESGVVTLDGVLEQESQKNAAEKSIMGIKGIIRIVNNITIRTVSADIF